MKALNIYIDDKQQRAFRRRAIRSFHQGKEYIEALLIRRGVGEFYVERFVPLLIVRADDTIVEYDDVQCEAIKNEARNQGLEFGTIHTHIIADSAPSKHDHVQGTAAGETLVGIIEIEKTKKGRAKVVTMDFWQPQLPCEVHVIRTRK